MLTLELRKIIFDDSIKIDVVMALPFFTSEAGAWVAYKKNAGYVHFMSLQVNYHLNHTVFRLITKKNYYDIQYVCINSKVFNKELNNLEISSNLNNGKF